MTSNKEQLRVASQEEVQEIENKYSKLFRFYIDYNNNIRPLAGLKLAASIERGFELDVRLNRVPMMRQNAIYNFSQEFIDLDDAHTAMDIDLWDKLTQEEKDKVLPNPFLN